MAKEQKEKRRKFKEIRIIEFINKIKNPYIFKINGKLVKIEFSDNDKTAEKAINRVIKNIYK